jgi:ferredoxin-NADP reductase
MKELKARLTERIKRTGSVESFRFAPPERIDFVAGQFMQVILDEQNRGNKELNKYLSFSSSPLRPYVEFTKRVSQSAFCQKLKTLKAGDEILLKAPLGACVYKEEYRKIAFLIGGIGITPVISIIEYITEKKIDTDTVLFYSNRNESDIAFKLELDQWQGINERLKIFYTVTDCQPQDKSCIYGRINKEIVQEKLSDLKERIIFIFGPPKMVEAINNLCLDLGCNKDSLKTESFIGY